MINFRYHVVSLTAVFLALAIGLVVGTAALNGPLADSLNERVNGLTKHNQQLRDQVGQLQEDVNREEDFAVQAAPYILERKLAGRDVVVLTMPSADGRFADGVIEMLNLADATVTGRIEIRDKMTDPANNVSLLNLAHGALPTLLDLPRNSNGVETSSALLATVLLNHTPALATGDQARVVTAYKDAGYIGEARKVSGPADAAIIIAGPPDVDREAASKNAAIVTLVTQFDEAGPLVVAGNGVGGDGNALAEVRDDPALQKTISTVDNVATPQGRLAAALAMVEQLRLGSTTTSPPGNGSGSQATTAQAGHYGTEPGSATLIPKQPE